MKIVAKDNYPEELKRYIDDYNVGIDQQDIMEVNLALDGILQLVFHMDSNMRIFSGQVLSEIARLQPGFLKKGVQILLHRYKGSDVEKSEYASIVLGLLTETPVKQLITDADLLKQILEENSERVAKAKFEESQKKEFLEKSKAKEIRFVGITGEYLRFGQFYTKLIIDEDIEAAQKTLEDLVVRTVSQYGNEETQEDFEMGCTTFSIIASPENREPVIHNVVTKILQSYEEAKKKQKEGYYEFIVNTANSMKDLLPQKVQMEFVSEANKRMEEKKKEQVEKIKSLQEAHKKGVNINVVWEKQIIDIANSYNESIKHNDEKGIAKIIDSFRATIASKDPYIFKSSIELYSQFLEKNYPLVEDFTQKLLKDYKKQEVSIILGENISLLDGKNLLNPELKEILLEEKKSRDAKEAEEKQKLKEEIEKIDALKVGFSATWDKRLLEMIEKINDAFIAGKVKDAEKIILGNFKNYIYAEDKDISLQAIHFLNNIANKYTFIIQKMIKEVIEIFKSAHERRWIAVDMLGLLMENQHKDILFKDIPEINELIKEVKADVEQRAKDVKQSQLEDKWDAIKLDVTTIIVDLEYDKRLQKVCRAYNEGIKAKDKETVLANVKIIVDWFLNEKNEEKLNQVIEVLGKISKQNIELIAPAIEMFLQMVEGKDVDTKFRAIKGLGEVAFQRPGWAYMAIEKLVSITNTDENEDARMKALVELSRIGRANPTMLMEHIDTIIEALRSPNKHVRRLAAFTLGSMAEAIPLEAQEAIPALREALHDEYHLVRLFSDKALKLIRAAMRK